MWWDKQCQVDYWAQRFNDIGIKNVLLSDTTGTGTLEQIELLFKTIPSKYPEIDFGAHFHNRYEDSYKKLKAAYDKATHYEERKIMMQWYADHLERLADNTVLQFKSA